MAISEQYLIPYKMASIAWDPAIIEQVASTNSQNKIILYRYKRIATTAVVCEVDVTNGGVRFFDGNYPPPSRVNQVKGVTVFEIE